MTIDNTMNLHELYRLLKNVVEGGTPDGGVYCSDGGDRYTIDGLEVAEGSVVINVSPAPTDEDLFDDAVEDLATRLNVDNKRARAVLTLIDSVAGMDDCLHHAETLTMEEFKEHEQYT